MGILSQLVPSVILLRMTKGPVIEVGEVKVGLFRRMM